MKSEALLIDPVRKKIVCDGLAAGLLRKLSKLFATLPVLRSMEPHPAKVKILEIVKKWFVATLALTHREGPTVAAWLRWSSYPCSDDLLPAVAALLADALLEIDLDDESLAGAANLDDALIEGIKRVLADLDEAS